MTYTITVISENTPGVLYRIAGILLRKKINIESLHVSEFDPDANLSCFTIEVALEKDILEKLVAQIERIIEVKGEVRILAYSAGCPRQPLSELPR